METYLVGGAVRDVHTAGRVHTVMSGAGLVEQVVSGSVVDCSSDMTVVTPGTRAGGLVANHGGGTIERSWPTGAVIGALGNVAYCQTQNTC